MDLQFLISQAIANGLIIGLLYLLMAIGFTLVFGVMRIANFAHGEFYMLGAFISFVCVTKLSLPYIVSVFIAFALTLALGWVVEIVVLKPFRGDGVPVTVHFDNGRLGGDVDLSEGWRVAPDPALIERLREWLAPENVEVVY